MSNKSKAQSSPEPLADRLIDIAGEIFAEKGPTATVREICKEAGCSIAAINYYFGDKAQLYVRCVEAACQRKVARFPLPEAMDDASPNELLRVFLRTIASRIGSPANVSWHNTLMLREVISPSPGVAQLLQPPFRSDIGILDKLLRKLLGSELDTEETRRGLVTQIIARCMFYRTGKNIRQMLELNTPANEDPLQYADAICDSILMQIRSLRQLAGFTPAPCSDDNNIKTNQPSLKADS